MSDPIKLSSQDAHVLARALAGKDITGLSVSPILQVLLEANNPKTQDGWTRLTQALQNIGIMPQIVLENPDAPPPNAATSEEVYIPDLPASAVLTDKALQGAESASPFLDQCLKWMRKRTPMTPILFLIAGCIWLLGVAIARRCILNTNKLIAPNLYILWVAETTIFKKTTGMEAVGHLLRDALPHLVLPQDMTPEAYRNALSGQRPSNYEQLPPHQKALVDRGRLYAAQRCQFWDEASSFLGAPRHKDYMQGLVELLLKGFDNSSQPTQSWRVREGLVQIHDFSLSILGATTPVGLKRSITYDSWETGELARFVLLYPAGREPYSLPILQPGEYDPPSDLIQRLLQLDRVLPPPPDLQSLEDEKPIKRAVITAYMTNDAIEQYKAYAKALSNDLLIESLDKRLWPNYARLPELAVKIALSLAAMNWADNSGKDVPRISIAEWARAQQITESWRGSLHRLLQALDISTDAQNDDRILAYLLKYPRGLTMRELTRALGIPRKAIEESLRSLKDAGQVAEQTHQPSRGPSTKIFLVV